MPPRTSTTEPRRRRGARRGGSAASSSRHRQASVTSFFTKAASTKPQPSSPAPCEVVPESPKPLQTSIATLCQPSSQSIPSSVPDSSSVVNETDDVLCIPEEAPETPSLDEGLINNTEEADEKRDLPSQDIPEEAADVMQLDDATVQKSSCVDKEDVSVDQCDYRPPAPERAKSKGITVGDGNNWRWQMVSLSEFVSIAPISDRQTISPFLQFSFPPTDKSSVVSPVTPGNPRSEVIRTTTQGSCSVISDDSEQPSRLSRRRNPARRAAIKAAQLTDSDYVDDDPIVVVDDDDDDDNEGEGEHEHEDERPIMRKSRKRCYPKSSLEKEKRVLHPFFTTTAASVKEVKDRAKRPRVVWPSTDAWMYGGATMHVNCLAPMRPWSPLPTLRLFTDEIESGTTQCRADQIMFELYPSNKALQDRRTTLEVVSNGRREIKRIEGTSSDMWVDKYKQDRRVDVISAAATKELVDWLTPWYVDGKHVGEEDTDSSGDESMNSFFDEPDPGEKERIAIISGPVGCGKSTIVANAARQLGLTVLEINASTCRTGKRIRDIIGEALRTHRVASNQVQRTGFKHDKRKVKTKRSSKNESDCSTPSAKTLILFEEVDELQEDEKGFWASLQELSASDDCRRPIVCTVNSFSSQMQQVFAFPEESVKMDFHRLMIHSKEEHIMNPVAFKHVSFQTRSERQAAAVLKRVVGSEKASISADALEYLALTYREDTRRAINLLHFFGSLGLPQAKRSRRSITSNGIEGRADLLTRSDCGVMSSVVESDLIPATFHVATELYAKKLRGPKSSKSEDSDALGSWCTSLSALSFTDTIGASAGLETAKRCGARLEGFDDLCLDADLEASRAMEAELALCAVTYSRQCMSVDRPCTFFDLAKDIRATDVTSCTSVIRQCPNPRRSILSEYIPTLRTMAFVESSKASQTGGYSGENQERSARRTRASLKKGGFCALDLGMSTVAELKRAALRSEV